MTKERKHKELGAKIYEIGLHILSIGCLYMLIDSLGLAELFNISFIGPTEIWWVWVLYLVVLTLRLFILSQLKKHAMLRGMLLTEYTEVLKRRGKN